MRCVFVYRRRPLVPSLVVLVPGVDWMADNPGQPTGAAAAAAAATEGLADDLDLLLGGALSFTAVTSSGKEVVLDKTLFAAAAAAPAAAG